MTVRDGMVLVGRGLMVTCISRPVELKLDLMDHSTKAMDTFPQCWRQMYHVTTRRIPADYKRRLLDHRATLRSMHITKWHWRFILGMRLA
eukprot:NODE_2355_length_939_cov_27.092135_g1936_i0.p3 GENE.NODE_2355_length_939_cov_27.092135_g1936_i0~~NODE_2355_length_939_cov_27.092135_g1936_i0.p3  ORF type:complete len:90 (-),score=20.90 NODE_2355_length_939_cov_27.092135_g1936_i0:154-423(-)